MEGRQAVRELLQAGRRKTREVVLARGIERAPIVEHINELAREQRALVREVSPRELDSLARTESPQGVVARAQPLPQTDLVDLLESQQQPGRLKYPARGQRTIGARHGGSRPHKPFLLALAGVTDPRNLGAVLRTAECAGVSGVLLPRHRAARVTPAVTKAAAGAIEYLNYASVPGLPAALKVLKSHDVWVVGLDAAGRVNIRDLAVKDAAVALVLGAEGRGLSRLVSQRCDVICSIPMAGALSSLSVSAAAAVACFEVSTHRLSNS